MPTLKNLRGLLLVPAVMLLAGCNMVLMNPSGDVAVQQRDLIIQSTVLMLLIVIPVIALTLWFAWKYRQSNTEAVYKPDWDHSTQLELVIWAAPLLIVIALGALTWISTHTLDPYRPLQRINADYDVIPGTEPLVVEVVALDWKWLFIYPQHGFATVNELAAPVHQPIMFKITASSVMNSFFIPALAGQIYAMPGMETKLHAVINKPGEYGGISANYSGAGFSDMRFKFHGMTQADFDQWVASSKKGADGALGRAAYLALEKPSEKVSVKRYASVAPDLYDAILNRCVEAGKMCMKDMAYIDNNGGLGKPGTYGLASAAATADGRPGTDGKARRTYVAAMCSVNDPADLLLSSTPAVRPN